MLKERIYRILARNRVKISIPFERIGKHDDWQVPIRIARNKDDDF